MRPLIRLIKLRRKRRKLLYSRKRLCKGLFGKKRLKKRKLAKL
jgi:hypothetical protein